MKPAAATANEPDELKADPIEESRGGDGRRVSPAFDAGVAFGRFFNDSSTVLFGAVSEAKNIANDISNIVAAEVRDLELELESAITSTAKDLAAEVDDWRSGLEHFNERVHFNESTAEEWSVSTHQDKVKGRHSNWAKEIKKLGKLERKKEKAEKQIKKLSKQITTYENIISTAEQEQVKTRRNLKALKQKAVPIGGSNQDKEKGGLSAWATEIKFLGQLEQRKEKAQKQMAKVEKQYTKYENIISETEREQEETMKNIKFLSNYRDDDASNESW